MSIQDVIFLMSKLRGGIPQFLYSDVISSAGTYSVRSAVIKFKADCPKVDEIDFIVNSPGGSPADAYRIVRTLRNNFSKVNVVIPFWAKSAATLLALGGSTIIMDEFGELGPLDAQIGKERDDSPDIERESALNDEYSVRKVEEMFQVLYEQMFFRLYEHDRFHVNKVELSKQLLEGVAHFYAPLMSQVNPYKLGEKSRSLEIGDNYATRILTHFQRGYLSAEQIKTLTDYLVNQCPDHGYVIDYDNIMEYMPDKTFVIKSDAIGVDYGKALSKLTDYFMQQPPQFVGFVLDVKSKASLTEDVDGEHDNGNDAEQEAVPIADEVKTNVDLRSLAESGSFGIIVPSN